MRLARCACGQRHFSQIRRIPFCNGAIANSNCRVGESATKWCLGCFVLGVGRAIFLLSLTCGSRKAHAEFHAHVAFLCPFLRKTDAILQNHRPTGLFFSAATRPPTMSQACTPSTQIPIGASNKEVGVAHGCDGAIVRPRARLAEEACMMHDAVEGHSGRRLELAARSVRRGLHSCEGLRRSVACSRCPRCH